MNADNRMLAGVAPTAGKLQLWHYIQLSLNLDLLGFLQH